MESSIRLKQCQTIYEHMDKIGPITSMEAIRRYEITRLSARIWDLTHLFNEKIHRKRVKVQTRWGETTVTQYTLMKEEEA